MMRAGSAKAPTLHGMPDDAYVTDLSAAIKKAAWAAKVSMTFGASCVVGVSMPDITIQRFRWPDMPTDALLSVALTEMAPFLPSGRSVYHIGCEVLGQVGGELEVMVAAMPEEHAIAVDTACRWANFKPKRLDIRENARSRLIQHWCAPIEGSIPYNFAILDAGPGAANIAFYHNGLFHSNRYFTPEFVNLGEVEDFETLMSVKAGGIGNNESAIRYDAGKLTGEIASATDHFYRMVGGERITCILLMDDENIPGIEDSLRANLNVPVLKPSQWVVPGLKRPNLRRLNQDSFLDAFAVGMPSLVGHDCRMDLRLPNIATQGINADASTQWQAAANTQPHMSAPAQDVMVHHTAEPMPQYDRPSISEAASVTRPYDSYDSYEQIQTPVPTPVPDPNPDPGPVPSRDYYYDNEGPEIPIPAGYVELPQLPPELAGLGLEIENTQYDEIIKEDKFHESPFDIVSAKAETHSGFPYAIPEDPRPDPSTRKPLFAAAALVVVILIIAILVPLRTTRALRAELRGIQSEISDYISSDSWYDLIQQRSYAYRNVNAILSDISNVNERMTSIHDFYLRMPALIIIPEIMEVSGLVVDNISAVESASVHHQIVVSGRTNNFRSIHDGVEHLRLHFRHNYLLSISLSIADTHDNSGIDAYGFMTYTITITVNPGWAPFWLNSQVVRSWQ